MNFTILVIIIIIIIIICFLRLHLWHMEVPRLGVESEVQLLAYTTATATPDLSLVCDLYHSSWQCQILNPLSEARGRTCILMDTSQVVTSEPWWELLFSLLLNALFLHVRNVCVCVCKLVGAPWIFSSVPMIPLSFPAKEFESVLADIDSKFTL